MYEEERAFLARVETDGVTNEREFFDDAKIAELQREHAAIPDEFAPADFLLPPPPPPEGDAGPPPCA